MLSGTIDDQLHAHIFLATADLTLLEQRILLRGTMLRPIDATAPEPAVQSYPPKPKKGKRAPEPAPKPAGAELTLELRNTFRVGSHPQTSAYTAKRGYELWLTPAQTADLRAKGMLEYRSQLPCNKLTITLEDYVAVKAPTQSL
jgi:hypothetical protein